MKRRMLVIGLAILLAVVGAVGVLLYVRAADDRALAGREAVTVLVAGKRIPAGTSARSAQDAGLLRSEKMPAGTVPEDALKSAADVDELVVSSDVSAGQLLVRPMFVAAARLTDGIEIPEGKIAVTVPAEAWQRVGGLAKPGAKVAIFDSFNVLETKPGNTPAGDGLQNQHDYNKATRLLLTDIEVLAVQQEKGSEEGTIGKALVTVAVDQAGAEKIIHAQQTGALYLALLGEKPDVKPGAGVDNRSVFGG